MIGNLDLNSIACYCQAFADYKAVTNELKGQPRLIEKTLPNGAVQLAENPLLKVQARYSDEMRKFANMFGLSVDGRLKLGVTKTTEKESELNKYFPGI